MLKFLSNIFSAIGSFGSNSGSTGCYWWLYDEPTMPEHLIEK